MWGRPISNASWALAGAVVAGIAIVIVGLALHGCGSSGQSATNQQQPVTIVTKNDANAPMGFSFGSPVTVRKGATVRWNNTSSTAHGIIWDSQVPGTSPAPGGNISTFAPGATSDAWTAPILTVPTTYNYHCTLHGPTMAGVITVNP
jgi:plastocyanin